MIPQHLYMIVPSEYATSIQVGLPMLLDGTYLMSFGWDVSTVHLVRICQTNGKTALHLYFQNTYKLPDWDELVQVLQFQTGLEDPFSDMAAIDAALCLHPGIMICRDWENLKERDPDFAATVTTTDEDGNTVERPAFTPGVIAL